MRVAFVHRRLGRVCRRLAFAAAVVPLALHGAFWAAGADSGLLALLTQVGELSLLPLLAIALLAGRESAGAPGTLRREGDEVVIETRGSRQRLPLAAVRGGVMVPAAGRASVELSLSDGDQIVAHVADLARAEALLRALHVDVASQRCRVQLADRTAATVVALGVPIGLGVYAFYFALLFGELLSHVPGYLVLCLAVGLYALAAALLYRMIALPDVTVGTDGLAFRTGLRERFVPFADLAQIRMAALGVRFVRRDGREVLMRSATGVSPARFEALMLRVRQAMAARDAAPGPALDQLDRRERSLPEWRASLAALARRGADYRAAGLSSEDLQTTLASPDATAERRIAAAVALSASKQPGAPSLIRVAAAQCASEHLRVALEKVSEGDEDDAAIAEALGEQEARHAS